MPNLKPHRITLLVERDGVPAGTPGLHIGRRSHFDLGYALEHGKGDPGWLPIFDGLVAGVDYEDHGEWDGTQGDFTPGGWECQPLLLFRS